MIYTNNYGLPQSFYNAIVNNALKREYYLRDTKAYLTTTGFTRGICESLLIKRHRDEIEVDVSRNVQSLLGQATHYILEQNKDDIEICEEPFIAEICGKRIAGIPDVYNTKTFKLSDYKTAMVFSYTLGDKVDYEIQLNINKYLMELAGYEINELEIVYIFKDWTYNKAKYNCEYPQVPSLTIPINKWETEKTIHFMKNVINDMIECDNSIDDDLPICTEHQRWHKDDTYAVKKEGRKSAVRVLNSMEDAERYIVEKNLDKKHSIEHRVGEDTKCENYCNVKQWCPHYNKLQG